MPIEKKNFNFLGKSKKLGSDHLVVSNNGAYDFLSSDEYHQLITHKMSDKLYERLESRKVIITALNSGKYAEKYRDKKINLFQGTSLHIVVVSLRCNLNCAYCHAASVPLTEKGRDMDKETATKTVDIIFQTPSPAITIEFQGGEPLLNFDVIKHIVKYAKELNKVHKKSLIFSLVTNLTIMTDEILDYLLKEEISICTSLDGHKKVHDLNRAGYKGRGSYDDTVKWIKKIQKSEYKGLNALMTVTKHSLPHYKEIVDEYVSLGLKRIWFRYLNNLGSAQEGWEDIGYTADEFIEFWKKGVEYVYSEKLMKKGFREMFSVILATKILKKRDPNFLDLQSPCGAAIGQLAYDYDGKIYSCDEGRMTGDDFFMLGNVYEDDYKSLFMKPKTASLIASSVNDTYLCDACIYQPYCGLCPVINYMNTGNVVPKLAQDFRCKILMVQFDYLFDKIKNDKKFKEYIMGFEVFKEPLRQGMEQC